MPDWVWNLAERTGAVALSILVTIAVLFGFLASAGLGFMAWWYIAS